MRKIKILYIIGDIGGGHKSAANALMKAFRNSNLQYEEKLVDIFSYRLKNKTSPPTLSQLFSRWIFNNFGNNSFYELQAQNR